MDLVVHEFRKQTLEVFRVILFLCPVVLYNLSHCILKLFVFICFPYVFVAVELITDTFHSYIKLESFLLAY